MARQPTTPWPTTPGSVFFGDAASGALLSRATKDGRIRRLARGLYSADLRADPVELIARNRWKIVAHLVPDAVIADRSAAEGGMPAGGVLTVISTERKEDVTLPGLIVAPRRGPGPLDDDGNWPEGLRLTSDARTLVDNLAVSRGRAGRPARTLSRDELEDWVVRTSQRRPDEWLATLRARALELCDELGVPDRGEAVADIIGAVAGTREARVGAGRLLAARAAGREYDPDRVARFDELACYLRALPPDADVPVELPALVDEPQTSLSFFEATSPTSSRAPSSPSRRPRPSSNQVRFLPSDPRTHMTSSAPSKRCTTGTYEPRRRTPLRKCSSCSIAATDSSWADVRRSDRASSRSAPTRRARTSSSRPRSSRERSAKASTDSPTCNPASRAPSLSCSSSPRYIPTTTATVAWRAPS